MTSPIRFCWPCNEPKPVSHECDGEVVTDIDDELRALTKATTAFVREVGGQVRAIRARLFYGREDGDRRDGW
jgi:hypothetical protein